MAPGLAIDPLFFRWVGRGLFGGISIFCTLQTHRKTLLFLFCSFSFFFLFICEILAVPCLESDSKVKLTEGKRRRRKQNKSFFVFCLVGNMGKKKLLQAGTR
jgi:hypothetical protein